MPSTAPARLVVAAIALLAAGATTAPAGNVKVARFWHDHQPIYWPDWSSSQPNRVQFAQDSIDAKNGGAAHPDNNLQEIFGHGDRVASYQGGPRNSLAGCDENAGYALSYSGSLIENVRSLANRDSLDYHSGWNSGNTEARKWIGGDGGPRLDLVGFCYHHALAPVLPKAVFRKELQIFKQAWWKAWGGAMDCSDHSRGFFPTEMAFTEEMIDVLKEENYDWVIVAAHHFSRTCPTYTNHVGTSAEANYNIMSSEPNKADMNGPSPTDGWWFDSPNPGNCAWNVAPFAYQLHKVQYVNPWTGAIKQMVAIPSDDVLSYKAGYSGATMSYAENIAYGANDPDHPVVILPATDGDNAWGGGSSSWNESWPDFTRQVARKDGWDNVTLQGLVNQYGDKADVRHIEDGAWIFPTMCYGSPYFLMWVDPPCNPDNLDACYPGTKVDLETPGFALKFWDWAPIVAGANWCETAEQIMENDGTDVAEWKIATPYEWSDGSYNDLNVAEKAWHIYLCGLDSGFNYYGGEGNDDECKPPLANLNAVNVLRDFMSANIAKDKTPPSMFRPQRFPWNPGGYTFGWFNSTTQDSSYRKKMGSDFYVWTHVYDVSGVPDDGVVLKVRADKDGRNPVESIQNELYDDEGHCDEVEPWISIPMTRRTLPSTTGELNAAANNSKINYEYAPAAVADYWFAKVTQFRGQLVDYYVEVRDTKGNWTRSDIQHVWVEDDGTPAEGGSGGKAASASFTPSAPTDTTDITVAFDAGSRPIADADTVYCLYSFDAGSTWADKPMTRTGTNTFSITLAAVNDAPSLTVCFHATMDGEEIWESRGGANWTVAIADADAPTDGVKIDPNPARAGESVTISYYPAGRPLANASAVNVHHGHNGANWTTVPGDAMTRNGSRWDYTFTVPSSAETLVMCFNDGTTWDNHDGNNWTFSVTGTTVPTIPFSGTAAVDFASEAAQSPLTVYYNPAGRVLAGASAVNVHYGITDADGDTVWTVAPGAAMSSREGGLYFAATFTPAPGSKTLTVCFNDGADNWDNNSEANWTFDLGDRYPAVETAIVVTSHKNNDSVESGTAAVSISGTAHGITGTIVWTNAANGATGSFPAAETWTVPAIPLATGDNPISFTASVPGTSTTVTVAADEAANYENWTDGSNASTGTAFGPWSIPDPIAGGASYFRATAEGNPNLDIGSSAFGIFAANRNNAQVIRDFTSPLAVGQTLCWTFENNSIDESGFDDDSGTHIPYGVGTALHDAEGNTIWQLYFNGGEKTYHQGPDGAATDFPWTDTGLDIAFTLGSDSTYSATVTPLASPAAAQTFTGTVSAPVERFRIWNFSAGPDDNYNLYFDNLELIAVESSEPVTWATEVLLVRQPADDPDDPDSFAIPYLAFDPESNTYSTSLDTTVPRSYYAFYECTDLTADTQIWTELEGTRAFGDGDSIILELPAGQVSSPSAFYRIGYTPIPSPPIPGN